MSDLRKNIHRYMEIMQIKHYSDLLVKIGKELKVKDAYEFAEKEKSNFSKMLKGERPLKHEYIIPLERIFGVSMARLVDEGAYALPLNKEDIPYVKGFRYYAYKDEMSLYEDEFERTMVTNDGYPTICNSDEFNKYFLDYVIEYRSANAIRYLIHKHNFKPLPLSRYSYVIDERYQIMTSMDNQLLNMVIQEDDVELFEKSFNPFETCLLLRIDWENVRIEDQTLEFILNSKNVFESLFVPKEMLFTELNRGVVGHRGETIKILNPLLRVCLDYALEHLDKYREKVKQILLFGIEYNKKALDETGLRIEEMRKSEYGTIYIRRGHEFLTSVVLPKEETTDQEILGLINRLPGKGIRE